jgi:hypothetical protein
VAPHLVALWLANATHDAPLQQPFAQEVALQTQLPAEQVLPVAHDLHAVPPVPHVVAPCVVWHRPFESQQPFGQEVALQTQLPFEHVVPVWQAMHDMPLMPQVGLLEGWQLPEPSRQKLPLHTHPPCALQVSLVRQAVQLAPLAPHICAEGAVTHCPFAQQPLQLLVPPHAQEPLVQACPLEQAPQAFPPEPQTVDDCAVRATQFF